MKRLTPNEIKFVKETGFTPTVYQCDQYYLTVFTDEKLELNSSTYTKDREKYSRKWYKVAKKIAKEKYDVDLDAFIDKNLNIANDDYDGISLEYVATYLLYCFFTKEELLKMTDEEAHTFLQDYRYYYGFRKWYGDCSSYIHEAIQAHDGLIEFYDTEDGNVWWREVENKA